MHAFWLSHTFYWKSYTYTFTANANYNQLWIYPTTANDPLQFNLYVDYINVCNNEKCTNTVNYNSDQVPIHTTKAGNINVGGSAGTGGGGTVTISQTSVTDLIAANSIQMVPGFTATVSTGGVFTAKIESCGLLTRRGTIPDNLRNIDVSQFKAYEDHIEPDHQEINTKEVLIYPTVTNRTVNIKGDFKSSENHTLIVLDVTGKIVLTSLVNPRNSIQSIDLNNLSNGIYFIQVKSNKKNVTAKVILNK